LSADQQSPNLQSRFSLLILLKLSATERRDRRHSPIRQQQDVLGTTQRLSDLVTSDAQTRDNVLSSYSVRVAEICEMLTCSRTQTPAQLADAVDCLWELRGHWRSGDDYLLPDVGIDIAIRMEGTIEVFGAAGWRRISDRVAIGSLDRAVTLRQPGPLWVIGIRLAPGCASVLGVKASELRNRIVQLSDLAPDLDASIERFACALGARQAKVADLFGILEGLQQTRPDGAILYTIRHLSRGADVHDIACSLNASRRHLYRRFVNEVGWTPSQFRRLARFSRASRMAASAPEPRWAELSQRAGYFDQAHLARDFQLFAGRSATSIFSVPWYSNFLSRTEMSHPSKTR
jgi:AraC-like DNA-binding protein